MDQHTFIVFVEKSGNMKIRLTFSAGERFDISYNWLDIGKIICTRHILTHKECPTTCPTQNFLHLWNYMDDDCNGRKGKDCSQRIQRAIEILSNFGTDDKYPDITKVGYQWGTDMAPKERLGYLSYKLSILLQKVNKFPEEYFLSDNYLYGRRENTFVVYKENDKPLELMKHDHIDCFSLHPKCNGKSIYDIFIEDIDENSVVHTRHPLHGKYAVDSFKKCMELYGMSMASGDTQMASFWWSIGLRMNDIPTKK